MKLTKYYKEGRFYVQFEDGDNTDCTVFDTEEQMRMLGRGLMDLADPDVDAVEVKIIKGTANKKIAIEASDHAMKDKSLIECAMIDGNFSVRTMNLCAKIDIRTIGDLLKWKKADLLTVNNFSPRTIVELTEMLKKYGFDW